MRKHAEWEPCALPSAATADSHAAAAGAEDAAARFTVIAHERAGAPNKWQSRERVARAKWEHGWRVLLRGKRAEWARRSG